MSRPTPPAPDPDRPARDRTSPESSGGHRRGRGRPGRGRSGRERRSWRRFGLPLAIVAAVASVYLAVTLFRPSATGRPTASTPSVAGPRPSDRGDPTASPTPAPAVFAFPVIGPVSYEHTHHDYPATDILSRCGSPVVAVTNAMVLDTTTVDAYDARVNAGATRGGLSVSILGDDGVRYYGSHMSTVDPGIRPGIRVKVGQRLGEVGRTGDASACHLHFGISPPCARVGDWWNQRGTVWPWPYLDSWHQGGIKSPVGEVTAWRADHGCPTAPFTDP